MGKRNAEAYGRRNSEEGPSACKNKTYKNTCRKDIAAWE